MDPNPVNKKSNKIVTEWGELGLEKQSRNQILTNNKDYPNLEDMIIKSKLTKMIEPEGDKSISII